MCLRFWHTLHLQIRTLDVGWEPHDGDPKPDGADDSGVAGNTDGEKAWGEVDSMDEETL
jgi:hypothetical protein